MGKKTNILIIKFSYNTVGGVDKQILRLSSELNKSNLFNVMLVTNNHNSILAKEFYLNGGYVYIVDFNKLSLFKSSRKILKIVKQQDINIIQSHLFRESIICRLVKLQCFKIKHLFKVQTFIDCAWIPTWKKNIYHFIDFISSRLVNIYVANGPIVENEIIKRSKIRKFKVVNIINGTEKIGEPDNLNAEVLPKKVAMVANLVEKKGHDVLIETLAILKKKGEIISVRLIGSELNEYNDSSDNTFKEKILKYAREYDVIDQLEFYGYTKDITQALANIPIVVLPSDSEGVPNSILEAMSLKKVVIASNVGAMNTLIEDKKNGFLHSPQNPEQFANILLNIYSMKNEKLNEIRHNAFIKWQTNFTLDIMFNKLLGIYNSI